MLLNIDSLKNISIMLFEWMYKFNNLKSDSINYHKCSLGTSGG